MADVQITTLLQQISILSQSAQKLVNESNSDSYDYAQLLRTLKKF